MTDDPKDQPTNDAQPGDITRRDFAALLVGAGLAATVQSAATAGLEVVETDVEIKTGIGEGSDDANRARTWIHLTVGQQDFALSRVGTPVSQDQVKRVSEKTDGVLGRNGAALFLCQDIRLFANRKVSFDGVHLRN